MKATFILIISTVFISAIISLKEQTKSDNAAKKLKKMITNKMDVIRDENRVTIDIEDIVPGDIVKLSSGDMILGDVRFIETKDLFIDQASLTGESNLVEKFSVQKEYETITDISNIGFMGTNNIPFIESKSSKQLLISTFTIVIITLIIAFTNISIIFDLSKLPYQYLGWIVILMAIYSLFIQIYKKIYIKNYNEWL